VVEVGWSGEGSWAVASPGLGARRGSQRASKGRDGLPTPNPAGYGAWSRALLKMISLLSKHATPFLVDYIGFQSDISFKIDSGG